MQLNIRGKNVKVGDDRRELIERKLGKLGQYLDGANATVELTNEQTKRADERLVLEMTVRLNGTVLRVEERNKDLNVALDGIYSRMQQQIARYKDRLTRRNKGRTSTSQAAAQLQAQVDDEPTLLEPASSVEMEDVLPVKIKEFNLQPMLSSDAIEEMELVGHDFFVFQDASNQRVSIVYRRKSGGYGLLRPDTV